jgi:hypothetical protein
MKAPAVVWIDATRYEGTVLAGCPWQHLLRKPLLSYSPPESHMLAQLHSNVPASRAEEVACQSIE